MASTIHFFKSATPGGTDGTQVRETTGTDYIELTVTAGGQSAAQQICLRTADNTTVTSGNVIITPSGTNAAKCYLGSDSTPTTPGGSATFGAASAALTLTNPNITGANYAIWIKVDAASGETPQIDTTTITLHLTGTEAPV